MAAPLFSLVLATRNSQHRLPGLLNSLQLQGDASLFELVVADAASGDCGLDLIAAALPPPLSRVVSWSDDGIYDAWNRALPALRGVWTLFLGDDDALAAPGVLAELARLLATNPPLASADAVLCSALLADGRLLQPQHHPDRFWMGMRFAHPAMLTRTTLLQRHGFDASYRIAGDYAFFLEHPQLRVALIPDFTLTRLGPDGISQTQLVPLAREVYRCLRSHGTSRLRSSYYPARILFTALRRPLWR